LRVIFETVATQSLKIYLPKNGLETHFISEKIIDVVFINTNSLRDLKSPDSLAWR
jgi:hypothetical protein